MSLRALLAVTLLALPAVAPGGTLRCRPDAVAVGPACIDKYEASVWSIPPENKRLISRVLAGKAQAAELLAAGATQHAALLESACSYDEYPETFPFDGNWTAPVYALSVAGVLPSTCITWFQAEQACRLSGKRLVRNEEWQGAAAGTPDPGPDDDGTTTCATNSPLPGLAGARSACVSRWGVHDMPGNVWEWVADWVPPAGGCTFWDAGYGGDLSCMGLTPAATEALGFAAPLPAGAPVVYPRELVSFDPNLPGAIIRGGNFATGSRNGVFAIYSSVNPSNVSRSTGFRCAR